MADAFVCTETQQLHIVLKLPVKESQLTNSFVQLSFPICFTARSASAPTVRRASLNSLPGHKPRNNTIISRLKCLRGCNPLYSAQLRSTFIYTQTPEKQRGNNQLGFFFSLI